MKNKKIGIIISAILIIGGIAGGIGYKTYLQDGKQQEVKASKKVEIQAEGTQEGKKLVDESTLKNQEVKVKSIDEQTKVTSENKKNSKVNNEEDISNSSFESKLESYVSEFRESEKSSTSTPDFIKKLDSLNTKNLNAQEKAQLANAIRGVGDWNDLNSAYSQIRMAGDGSMDDIVKYGSKDSMNWAKEVLTKIDVNNIIATGVMSKADAEKEISFLKEYAKKQQVALDKQDEQMKLENQKVEAKYKELDQQYAKLKTKQEKEDFYYNKINEAMQKQSNYINSIKEPEVKQSVQTSFGAANGEATFLEMRYPKDSEIIQTSLSKVINGK
ncbi:MAG: hypothetical protein ACRC6T_17615 [Sarcina sp.]